jgi:hypothetical protein
MSNIKKELQRLRRHSVKFLAETRARGHGDVYIKHWTNAVLFATTDTDDEQELRARLECFHEEMDAIVACIEEDEAQQVAP